MARLSSWSRVFATCALLCVCTAARAQAPTRLEADLALGVSGSLELRSVILASTLLELSAPVSDESAFVAQWGFALATGEPTSDLYEPTHVAVGNPLLGWSLRLGEGLVFTPSLTLPVATMPRGESRLPAALFAFSGALGLRAGLDRWLWLPDRLSIVLPFTFAKWLDPILIESHLKLAFLLPVVSDPLSAVPSNGRNATDIDEFAVQAQVRLAARLGTGVWGALRFSLVYVPTGGDDKIGLALGPELRFALGPWSHAELGLTMNLDTPLGPSWEPGRFWGVTFGASTPL